MTTKAVASEVGWALHDLGLAAAFGGSLFGKVALHDAVKEIPSEHQRSLVVTKAWSDYNIINSISIATAAATWIFGRTFLSGVEVSAATRPLVIAKDVLMGVTVVTGAANMAGNIVKVAQLNSDNNSAGTQVLKAPETNRALDMLWKICGPVNIAAMGGVIGLTAILAMKAGKSTRWSFLSNLLP